MRQLKDYQISAIKNMKNGCILCGDVGSGKSFTALAYYYLLNGGSLKAMQSKEYIKMTRPKDLYIITTARKRDTLEWDGELSHFLLSRDLEVSAYSNKVIVDSWNNIKKYTNVSDAFFIFDEQRVVGSGAWVKAFLKIVRHNEWILLSATPGDTWSDYIPVFIANGFYKNMTEFRREHIVYSNFSKFPKIDRYISTKKLEKFRDNVLVNMDFKRKTRSKHDFITVSYDMSRYKDLMKHRWDYKENKPIETISKLCFELRKIVNEDESRQIKLLELLEVNKKVIIFYNFDYELVILLFILELAGIETAQWNGHKHENIPKTEKWAYLVQYNSGCEGWNCIETNTIIFYSLNYSYKVMKQASGRIDRLNTPFENLYYYYFKSNSNIDLAIYRALMSKKKFNESKFIESRTK